MADMTPQGTQENGLPNGHEQGDAHIRSVVLTMTIILSSAAVFMVVVWTMFRYLEARENRLSANTPALFMQRQIPPKPRLLPSPFNEKDKPLGAGGNRAGAMSGSEAGSRGVNALDKSGSPVDSTSDDLLPWDKMRVEGAADQAQVESYTQNGKTGALTVPVERAKELMAPGANRFAAKTQARRGASGGAMGAGGGHNAAGGHAAPGETGGHEGEAHSTAGKQSGATQGGLQQDLPAFYGPIYSESSNWESEDQSLSADSSGGRILREKSR